jgi:hypothetical protein
MVRIVRRSGHERSSEALWKGVRREHSRKPHNFGMLLQVPEDLFAVRASGREREIGRNKRTGHALTH